MADILSVLKTLVNKDDARRWAAVNNQTITEKGDAMIIGDYTLVFNEDGRLFFVEPRVPEGKPLG
ncbi:hypothetical protein PP459_gp006 [Streptomyces phage Wakanda]|uniref:Uncharacterized protein n=2 Tax=Wakandavirus TaxID=3044854 RepID=A0A6G8R2Z2_9CAUD|nr:hypothetical protein PP459_gp006 [Streptomyces phage Wakanda]YP_010652321.1 hypothetical protein PP460_gp007 [Streptomyces phage Muntaha]QIN94002.1 hypothetical protein SEA_WAKANDA_6 [Streptomyces phage Wakanda]QIN94567.1 hypothetical protein SEA_MUNTAHA_7 [Streptomyces phage Muntaha]